MFTVKKTEAWQQDKINSLTLKLIFAATLGTLAATALAWLVRYEGWGAIKPELLFIPWGIALVCGVSVAFRAGVMAERQRLSQPAPNA